MFSQWFEAARGQEVNDPEAMSLATVDADGLPDVRMVLCKGVEGAACCSTPTSTAPRGAQSRRSRKAAALFHWKSLRRQARFRGAVTPFDDADRRRSISIRGRATSQIGAWASRNRARSHRAPRWKPASPNSREQFGDGEIPRPPYWRGYRLEAQRGRALGRRRLPTARPRPFRARRARVGRGGGSILERIARPAVSAAADPRGLGRRFPQGRVLIARRAGRRGSARFRCPAAWSNSARPCRGGARANSGGSRRRGGHRSASCAMSSRSTARASACARITSSPSSPPAGGSGEPRAQRGGRRDRLGRSAARSRRPADDAGTAPTSRPRRRLAQPVTPRRLR